MKVTQKIMIGSLRINLISNSSIFQIGSTGLVQAYAKDTDEYYTITGEAGAGTGQPGTVQPGSAPAAGLAGAGHPPAASADDCSDNID